MPKYAISATSDSFVPLASCFNLLINATLNIETSGKKQKRNVFSESGRLESLVAVSLNILFFFFLLVIHSSGSNLYSKRVGAFFIYIYSSSSSYYFLFCYKTCLLFRIFFFFLQKLFGICKRSKSTF